MEKRKIEIEVPIPEDNRCGRNKQGYKCDTSLCVYLSTQEKETLRNGCDLLGIRVSTLLREVGLQVSHMIIKERTVHGTGVEFPVGCREVLGINISKKYGEIFVFDGGPHFLIDGKWEKIVI